MEGTRDARTARDRCLATMIQCEDEKTRRSLWKAALRYQERVRGDVVTGSTSPLAALGRGGC